MSESLYDMLLHAAEDLCRIIDEQERVAPLSAAQALDAQAAKEVIDHVRAERQG